MAYIIIWRQGLKEPHVGKSDHDFLETYETYKAAKEAAEEMHDINDKWYCDYAIFKEVKG